LFFVFTSLRETRSFINPALKKRVIANAPRLLGVVYDCVRR
jgi:hypothetical protein